jgi:hypothetical protein
MAITVESGIKVFSESRALARNGASCIASTGSTAQDFILNFDKNFAWSSVGSDDSTTETLTITLPETTAITRLYLTGINWRQFKITYNSGLEFTNVTTLDKSGLPSIFEFSGDKSTAYFEFDTVNIQTIEITIYNTIENEPYFDGVGNDAYFTTSSALSTIMCDPDSATNPCEFSIRVRFNSGAYDVDVSQYIFSSGTGNATTSGVFIFLNASGVVTVRSNGLAQGGIWNASFAIDYDTIYDLSIINDLTGLYIYDTITGDLLVSDTSIAAGTPAPQGVFRIGQSYASTSPIFSTEAKIYFCGVWDGVKTVDELKSFDVVGLSHFYNMTLSGTNLVDIIGGVNLASSGGASTYIVASNEQKTCNIFGVMTELGTFSNSGLFAVSPTISTNDREEANINNKVFIQKGVEVFRCSLNGKYIASQADVDLVETLRDSQENFILWLCGGHFGGDYYRLSKKPWRLEDIYRVQTTGNSSGKYYSDNYYLGIVDNLSLVEVA